MKLLKLYQPSCTPCQFVDNYLTSKNVSYESVDIMDNPDVAVKYGIMSTPVTILLDDEGKEVARLTGYHPAVLDEFIQRLN